MIVGGAFRGFVRARRIATQYVVAYFAVGLTLIVAAGILIGLKVDSFDPIGALTFAHFWLSGFLFPMAVAANLLFVRLFPRRTWRGERWRSWIGGGAGVVLTWGGIVLVAFVQDRPPRALRDFFGEAAAYVHWGGWLILLSNLGLLLAWLLPSRRPSPGEVGRGRLPRDS